MGNSYIVGYFYDTVDFDHGPSVFNLISKSTTGYKESTFILKLDGSGNFVWAKKLGGSGVLLGFDIALDKDWNIYTTGLFRGTCDFNPDTGIYNLTATFSDNIFISKLDNFGKFIWAKSLCNGGQCWSKSIALDFNGNVYTTGYMEVTADFDSGPNVYNLNPIDY